MMNLLIKNSLKTALFLGLLVSSCGKPPLTLYTQYIDRRELASYHVGTPDPKLDCPDIGQRLVVKWNVPLDSKIEECRIEMKALLGNRQTKSWSFGLSCRNGYRLIELLNEEYCQTQGFVAFKAELWEGLLLRAVWQHQLWNETVEAE